TFNHYSRFTLHNVTQLFTEQHVWTRQRRQNKGKGKDEKPSLNARFHQARFASFANTVREQRLVDAQAETVTTSRAYQFANALVGIWTNHQIVRWKRVLFVFANIHSAAAMSSPKVRICGSTDERSQTTFRSRMLRRWKWSRRMLLTNVCERSRMDVLGSSLGGNAP
ncbi:unnamed protein product, partial [Nesidiocoris tenuis]